MLPKGGLKRTPSASYHRKRPPGDSLLVRDLKIQLEMQERREQIMREGNKAQIRALERFAAKQVERRAALMKLREQDARRLEETTARLNATLAELRKTASAMSADLEEPQSD